MQVLDGWKDALGILSVAMAIIAAIIYVIQTLRGEVRPHPLSWFLFEVLSATGYWVQRDQGAPTGSWTLLAMTIICFLFVAASVARGERSFSRQEWAFTIAGGAVFILYLFTREANVAAALMTIVDALGYGPTFMGFVAFDGFAVVERGFGQTGAHGAPRECPCAERALVRTHRSDSWSDNCRRPASLTRRRTCAYGFAPFSAARRKASANAPPPGAGRFASALTVRTAFASPPRAGSGSPCASARRMVSAMRLRGTST